MDLPLVDGKMSEYDLKHEFPRKDVCEVFCFPIFGNQHMPIATPYWLVKSL